MSTTESDTEILQGQGAAGDRKRTVFASGGVIGAILASTCCIVPLTFVMLGISGAWVSRSFLSASVFGRSTSKRDLPVTTVIIAANRNRPSSPRLRSGFRQSWSCSR